MTDLPPTEEVPVVPGPPADPPPGQPTSETRPADLPRPVESRPMPTAAQTGLTRRAEAISMIDPRHPDAEAEAQAWDKGVVSLTDDTLVLAEQGDIPEQTVDMVGRRLVLQGGALHIVTADGVDALYEEN